MCRFTSGRLQLVHRAAANTYSFVVVLYTMANLLRSTATVLLLSCVTISAQAQFSKTVHHTFETDQAKAITIELAGNVTVDTWAGNTVLVQTDIRMYNASKGIFTYFVEQAGRYEVLGSLTGETLNIVSKDPKRDVIVSKIGDCVEEVNVKVLVPKTFAGEGAGPYTRQEPDAGR